MKIAVIKTGGKQYVVTPSQKLKVELLTGKEGSSLKLDTLLMGDTKSTEIGKPSLKDKLEAKIIEHGKRDKIIVVKYKNKTRYKRKQGHRQAYTQIQIEKF